MFFSSHVTGQSHNPARGRRLVQSHIRGVFDENLPQRNSTNKRSSFPKLVSVKLAPESLTLNSLLWLDRQDIFRLLLSRPDTISASYHVCHLRLACCKRKTLLQATSRRGGSPHVQRPQEA